MGERYELEIRMLEVNETMKAKLAYVNNQEEEARATLEKCERAKEQIRKEEVIKIMEYIQLKNYEPGKKLDIDGLNQLLKHCIAKLKGEADNKYVDFKLY